MICKTTIYVDIFWLLTVIRQHRILYILANKEYALLQCYILVSDNHARML